MNQDLLRTSLEGNYSDLSARLKRVEIEKCSAKFKVTGHFYYLPIRNGSLTRDEFVEYLYHRIVEFCIPRTEREIARVKLNQTNDFRHVTALHEKAVGLFISGKQQQKTAGEPGELILFCILEGMHSAPQAVSKMNLKTSTEMPVFGSDGIHVRWNQEKAAVEFIWGESKLYQSLPDALDKICKSIKEFIEGTSPGGKPGKSRDIDLLRDHGNFPDGVLQKHLINLLDPFAEESNSYLESFACLACFDYEFLKNANRDEVEQEFLNKYIDRIHSAFELFESKVETNKLTHLNFLFFLLPFDSVSEFRKAFFARLGVNSD
ncbi:MAG: DUF1837 domain-containing protein [Bdellovibrionaceae bacterium]|nr:DUF1837 domain-containing protein [Pseudobdellovibrionaceae bacterium]